ncbi:ATP-dependent DNA helicase [Raineyella sp.]|uniref:ATP-dependent DNA helicase n=1 Tax=Raineyella sp. TaxID=1911550 RepID=UPI002B2035DF|nr:ATP-dependent DNA helicase [Raineyella sp.]MEA5154715.1 ATP-dependent DNA helicase [Raineyella sp.]
MTPLDGPALCDLVGIRFSPEQLAAITAPLEPGVIIAGAGTGKTTVMAARVVWLVASGMVRPDQVLGLTFTRKAARELGARIGTSLESAGLLDADGENGGPTVATYDSFAGMLCAEHAPRLGVEGDLRLVDDAELFALADRVVGAGRTPAPELAGVSVATVVERVVALSGEMLANGVSVADLLDQCAAFEAELDEAPLHGGKPYKDVVDARGVVRARRELAGFVRDLWEAKGREGVVEFADRTALAARLATEVPGVGRQLREEYRVVLLDEYQDTSAAQTTMLAGLFSGSEPASGRGFPVTAVGDPLQAIYEWRGAAVGTIAGFPVTFPAADGSPARHFTLRTNRRSGTRILEVANEVSAPLRATGGPACPAALVGPEGSRAGTVTVQLAETWDDEAAAVVRTLLAEHTQGTDWGDIAILGRRRADLAVLHRTLEEAGIPSVLVGLGGLLALPECAQVIAVLRLLHDVTDNLAVMTLLAGPRWRLGHRDLAALRDRAKRLAGEGQEPCLLDAVDDPGPDGLSAEARERLTVLSAELSRLRSHAGEPVGELVARVVRISGIVPELLAERGPDGSRQLDALVEAVEEYGSRRASAGLAGLLAWFEAEARVGRGMEQAPAPTRDAVTLLTVHASKGLEWDVVLLPAVVEGVFPSTPKPADWTRTAHVLPFELRGDADGLPALAGASRAGLLEMRGALKELARGAERRLGYVAVSRARHRLHVSGHRWHPDTVRERAESPFLRAARTVLGEPSEEAAEGANPYLDVDRTAAAVPDVASDREPTRDLATAVEHWRATLAAGGAPEPPTDADVAALATRWRRDGDRLLARLRARNAPVDVDLPGRLSVTEIVRGMTDPEDLRDQVRRPMPVQPSRRATLGTRFHAWVEDRFRHQGTLDVEFEGEQGIAVGRSQRSTADDEMLAEFDALCRAFESGRFADRQPYALELPFALTLGGRLVRGRIDAVYRQPSGGATDLLVVDWKTHRGGTADPLQLALYRLAAARTYGLELDRVAAGFYYVRRDRFDLVEQLPGVEELVADVSRLTAVLGRD